MPSVKIGPSFFSKEFNSYSDWRWAYAREICQNSLDAPGTSRIEVTISLQGEDTLVVVRNDGEPMTREILVDKLLALGESGKNFAGGVGGFGKAKLLLYLCHLSWTIRTGTLQADGVGGDYELQEDLEQLSGTESRVLMAGDQQEALLQRFRKFALLAQRPGVELVVNGEELPMNLKKGSPRREFEFGRVYTNRQHQNLVVVRMDGMPMFSAYAEFKGCVVVELEGRSDQVLTDNRDGLRWGARQEFDQFLLQLAVDKRSALMQKKAEIRRFEGERLRNQAKQPRTVGTLLDVLQGEANSEVMAREDARVLQTVAALVASGQPQSGIAIDVVDAQESAATIGPEFLLQNTTGLQTPEYYLPGPQFSDYSRKLALAWARCLLELHKLLDLSGEFSIGFILDEDCGALYSKSPEYGVVYYLNPARVVSQQERAQCRSFKRRFTGAWQDRYELISLAVHELVHGLGFSVHDEDYSSKLTELSAKVFPHIPKLSALFRG